MLDLGYHIRLSVSECCSEEPAIPCRRALLPNAGALKMPRNLPRLTAWRAESVVHGGGHKIRPDLFGILVFRRFSRVRVIGEGSPTLSAIFHSLRGLALLALQQPDLGIRAPMPLSTTGISNANGSLRKSSSLRSATVSTLRNAPLKQKLYVSVKTLCRCKNYFVS